MIFVNIETSFLQRIALGTRFTPGCLVHRWSACGQRSGFSLIRNFGDESFVERIFQFDFFRYRHPVFRDQRRTEFRIEDDVASLRSQG